MLKMFSALWRTEPIARCDCHHGGSTVVAYTADGENHQPVAIDRYRVRDGLLRLAPWPAPIFVNVYEEDRQYGGPEEGGWWVNTRTPMHSEQVVSTGDVWQALWGLSKRFTRNVANSQGTSSVVYDGGEYSFWLENQPAEFYPNDPEAWRYS